MTYTKGQILNLDLGNGDHKYLVLKADGDIVELLCLYIVYEGKFGSSNGYFGSTVDTYLENDFYNSLSQEVQEVIPPQNITQYEYGWNRDIYSPSHASYADYSTKKSVATEKRHIYLLDVEDIEKYFNHKFTSNQLRKLFRPDGYYWLRSAYSSYSSNVFCVNGYSGYVSNSDCYGSYAVRPAFTIDLSKISNLNDSSHDNNSDLEELQDGLLEVYPWLTSNIMQDFDDNIMLEVTDVFNYGMVERSLLEDLKNTIRNNLGGSLDTSEAKEFIMILLISLGYAVFKITEVDDEQISPPDFLFGFTKELVQKYLRKNYQDKKITGEFIEL